MGNCLKGAFYENIPKNSLDTLQPIVVITMSVSSGKDYNTKINLQTSISQRRIDY